MPPPPVPPLPVPPPVPPPGGVTGVLGKFPPPTEVFPLLAVAHGCIGVGFSLGLLTGGPSLGYFISDQKIVGLRYQSQKSFLGLRSKEIKQKEVLTEYIQQTHDHRYATPVLDKVTIKKRENLWELLFQDEAQGLFETEEAAERHAEILLKEC